MQRPIAFFLGSVVSLLALLTHDRLEGAVIGGPLTNPANAHVYFLLSTNVWTLAEAEAQTLGGHLATINDAAEDAWVLASFGSFGGTSRYYWIGLNDAAVEGTFVWANGETNTYRNWSPGEPNALSPSDDYVLVLAPSDSAAGKWNDAGNISNLGAPGLDVYAVAEVVSTNVLITGQPQDTNVFVGGTASFAVQVSGAPPVAYQWRSNSVPIPGATNSALVLSNVQLTQAGSYSVTVSNAFGTTNSAAAALTVTLPSYSLSGDFSLAANPSGPWSYGWKSNLTGALTLDTYTQSATDSLGALIQAWHRLPNDDSTIAKNVSGVTGGCCSGEVVHPPGSVFIHAGHNGAVDNFAVMRFTVPAGGDGIYQVALTGETDWNGPGNNGDVDFHVVRNATALFDQFLPASAVLNQVNRGGYTNVLALAAGETIDLAVGRGQDGNYNYSTAEVTFDVAMLTNGPVPPFVTSQPQGTSVFVGGTASFAVQAVGTSPITYQWYSNSVGIADATNTTLLLINAQLSQAGNYFVIISNAFGAVTSSVASLSVTAAVSVASPSNLVGWWRGEGDASDQAGGNAGSFQGVAGYAAGKVGLSFAFSGTNTLVVPSSPNLNVGTGTGLTIEAWIFPTNLAPVQSLFEWNNSSDSSSSRGVQFKISQPPAAGQGAGCLFANVIDAAGASHLISSAPVLVSNVFQHVALTYDKSSGVAKLYQNGLVVAQQSLGSFTPRTSLDAYLGGYLTGTEPRGFQGRMDEISLYNRALTDAEILGIHDASYAGKNALTNLQIYTQPQTQGVVTGGTLTLSVGAAGAPTLGYQWYFSGASLATETNATLLRTNVSSNVAGNYFVVVSNTLSAVTSATAVVTVYLVSTVFFDDFEPDIDLSQWTAFGGAPSAQNYGGSVSPTHSLWFGGSGSRFAESKFLNVSNGGNVSFYLRLSGGSASPWEKADLPGEGVVIEYATGVGTNWAVIGTYNTSNYTNWTAIAVPIPVAAQTALTKFRWRQLSNSGTNTDHWALDDVRVEAFGLPTPPVITQQPASQTNAVGASVTFDVAVSGSIPFMYQWHSNSVPIAGATNSALVLSNVQLTQAGSYSVTVSNAFGTTNSAAAALTVTLPSYSLSGDFSLAANPSGAWSYGWKSNLNGALTLHGFTKTTTEQLGNTVQFWSRFASDDSSIAKNISSFAGGWTDGQVKHGPGAIWFTPGHNGATDNFCVARFTVPAGGDGIYQVVGLAETDCNGPLGGDTEFHVVRGGTLLFSQFIPASTNVGTTNRAGTTNTLSLAAGETVDFAVGRGQDGSYNYSFAEVAVSIVALGLGQVGPTITGQPQNLNTVVGGTATFAVQAFGSAPLAYQWHSNNVDLTGATNSSLILSNVQFSQAGGYSVTVSNGFGTTNSSSAALTVSLPPALVRLPNTNAAAGGTVSVPIEMVANGNENALSLSLNYDPAVLTYVSTTLGGGAPGGQLYSDFSQTNSGRLGVAVLLAPGGTFSAGVQEIAVVSFAVAVVTNAQTTALAFGDQPYARQLSDVSAQALPASYATGSVAIAQVQFEGDVSPRPGGNQTVDLLDVVQVGRFAVGLDTAASGSEFQRADSAPRSTLGNGLITLTDWVQAGRYFAHLDPLTPAGGPTSPSSFGGAGGVVKNGKSGGNAGGSRVIRLVNATLQPGQTNTVSIELDSLGDEHGLAVSVNYNAAVMTVVSVVAGSGAAGATVIPNTNTTGRVALLLALSGTNTFAAGTREAAQIKFAVPAAATGLAPVTFGDTPAIRQVSDPAANELAASYTDGAVTLNGALPTLRIERTNASITVMWPLTAPGFELNSADQPGLPTNLWNAVGTPPGLSPFEYQVTLPATNSKQFFRLRKP